MKEELKIKDVMVGDWVDVRNNAAPNTPHLERITPSHFLRDEHWYGVELVPEILEMNGFKYKEGKTGLYGVTIAPHYICDGVPFEVFCDGEPFAIWFNEPVNVKFVHELQHVLRFCGITREIIL